MSDTPRTDAVEVLVGDDLVKFVGMVEADFARQLERELNAANERIKRFEFAAQKAAHDDAWARKHWVMTMATNDEWKVSCWHKTEQRLIAENAPTITEAIRNLHNTCDLIDLCERPSHE